MHDPRDDEFPALTELSDDAAGDVRDQDVPAVEASGLDELAPGAVRRERVLSVPADEAWVLLRDADGLSRWLADDVDVEVAAGERGTLVDDDGALREVAIDEVEQGRRVALRWWTADGETSLVDVVLDDLGSHSRLTVTEIPLQVVAVPDVVPASWTIDGGTGGGLGGASGPQLLALACR